MEKPPRLTIAVLLLASVATAAVALDPASPASRAGTTYRQFLPAVHQRYRAPELCLPIFDVDRPLLAIETDGNVELIGTADLNGDGWTDAIVARLLFQTLRTFEITVLLNDQQGGLADATHQVFEGPVPRVQHPTTILLRDFNRDGRTDVFIADSGMDTDPVPGYQNTLVLSAPGGKLVDATARLPQQLDNTHRAAAADIDGDSDIDLYVSNIWAQNMLPPAIWLNTDGAGTFSAAPGRLPYPLEDLDFGAYTTCQFVDVNNDASPDLVLGDAGDGSQGGPDSLVLLNDGTGHFSVLSDAMPPKPFADSDVALDIDATDIDGDRYQDLLMVFTKQSYTGRYIQVLINKGDGRFVDATPTRLSQAYDDSWVRNLQLLDLNYDGHLDFVVEQIGAPGPLFYLNDGRGVFREWDHGLVLDSVAFLDIDRDGWRDLLNCGLAFQEWPEWYAIRRHIGCQGAAP